MVVFEFVIFIDALDSILIWETHNVGSIRTCLRINLLTLKSCFVGVRLGFMMRVLD